MSSLKAIDAVSVVIQATQPGQGANLGAAAVHKVRQEAPPAAPVSRAAVSAAVDAINAQLRSMSRTLNFSVDQETGRTVVKVMDGETVIRQMPSEEALAISHALGKLQGLIIERKV